jgi:hypothetical protein
MFMEHKLARAARRAIAELELPCEVKGVLRVSGGSDWCIRFTTGYGQLSHSFRDEEGRTYFDDEILETIKQHLLLQEEMRVHPSER